MASVKLTNVKKVYGKDTVAVQEFNLDIADKEFIVFVGPSGCGKSTTLDEAARVDGATRWQVFYKVIMPLSGSIIIYTILMGFMAPWGDFMLASYIINENSAGMSVAVGMYEWLSNTMLNTN